MTEKAARKLLACLEGTDFDYLQVDFPLFVALLCIVNHCELINLPLIVGQAPLLTRLFRGFAHQLLLVDL
jgi:hypothetical protein